MTEIGIEAARAQLGDLAEAAQRGQTIYLTRRGRRIARIAPLTDPTPGGPMQLINLTPHTITLVNQNGATTTIEPSGPPARVTFAPDQQEDTVTVDGIEVPIVRTATTGVVTGLPAPQPGTLHIVSRQVVDAVPDRPDLVCTHDAVRDQQTGRIVGCRKLARPV